MDCHSLTRRQLQTLCKKYGIPANTTNVHMANCLSDLLQSKPELEEDAANVIHGAADATPKPDPRKAKGAQLEASSHLEVINLPLFSTPANTAARGEEKDLRYSEKNKFEGSSVPRTCIIDPSASQSRVKKGSVSFSDTVEVMKVMQNYDEPMAELTPSVNARRTRTTTRLSVGGTPAGKRNSAVKSDTSASDTVEVKAVSATKTSSRKASSKEPSDTTKVSDKSQETRLTPAPRRERKTSSVNYVDNTSVKPAEGASTGRGRPPRTPKAQPYAGSNSVLSEVMENGNDMVTPAACSSRKSSRSNFGTLERKHLDSEFERLGRSENEKSSLVSADDKNVVVEGEGDRRVTRGSIARVTRSASKSSITVSAQIMCIANSTPTTNGRSGRLTRKSTVTTSCLTKSFKELSLCDDTQSIESSSIIASGTKEDLVGDVAIKTDPASVDTVSVDSGLEHVTKALNSEVSVKGQFEEYAAANIGAMIPVGRSMEESGQDVPSEDSYAHSDNIVLYEESQCSNPNEFIREVIMSVAEDAMLNSDILKDETNSVPCKANCHVSESGRSAMDCDPSAPLKMSDGPSVEEGKEELCTSYFGIQANIFPEVCNEVICSTDVIENIGFDNRPASSTNVVENANLVDLCALMKGIIYNTANLVMESEEQDVCNGLVINSRKGTEACPLEESAQGVEPLNESEAKDATLCLKEYEDIAKSPKVSHSLDAACSLAECSSNVPVESEGQSSTCSLEGCKESMNASYGLDAAYSLAKCNGDESVNCLKESSAEIGSLNESGSQKATFYLKEHEENVRSSDGLSNTLDLPECIEEESVYHLKDSSEDAESGNESESNVTRRSVKEGETGVELENTFESSDISDSHADSSVSVESMDQPERVEDVISSEKFETEDTSFASSNIEPLEDPVFIICDRDVEPSNQSACSVFGESEDAEEVLSKPIEDCKEPVHLEGTDLFLDVTKESELSVDVTKESKFSVDVAESSCIGTLKHFEHEVGAYAVVEEDNEDNCMDLIEHAADNFSIQHRDAVHKQHCEEESQKVCPDPILECLIPGSVDEAGVGLMVEQFTTEADNGNPGRVVPNLGTDLDVIVHKFANLCTSGDEEVQECTGDMFLDSTNVNGQSSAPAEEHVKESTVSFEGEANIKGMILEGDCSLTSEKHTPSKNGNMSMEESAEAAKSVVEIEPCSESILAPKSNSDVESKLELSPNKPQVSSLSLRKLKGLVKKKDKGKLCQTSASRSTKADSKSLAPSKRVETGKSNETSDSVTPVSGPKNPWRLSAKPTKSLIASQSSDSPSSVGKRSALKSLPSNVRQASTEGGRTPTGKLNVRGLGVVQVGSPAIQGGDAGTEN